MVVAAYAFLTEHATIGLICLFPLVPWLYAVVLGTLITRIQARRRRLHPQERRYDGPLIAAARQMSRHNGVRAEGYLLYYYESPVAFMYAPVVMRIEEALVLQARCAEGKIEVSAEYFDLNGRFDPIRREVGVATVTVQPNGDWQAYPKTIRDSVLFVPQELSGSGLFTIEASDLAELLRQLHAATPLR